MVIPEYLVGRAECIHIHPLLICCAPKLVDVIAGRGQLGEGIGLRDESAAYSRTPGRLVRVDQLVGQQVEPETELEEQFVLPLLDQATWGDDQALPHVVAQQQLLDIETGHDGLAGAWVVGEQEPERGAGQKLPVDGPDLMGQRPDIASGHSEHRVEKARHRDSLGLSYQFEVRGVGIEGSATRLSD